MAADWAEVKRLAADFQRAQLGSTIQKLSERNCIEIVKKLIELKLISVIFTSDGKEYLTSERLLKEIRDELIFHGGRINLVELSQVIGVDYSHVEAKAVEFSKSRPDVLIILGQLITSEYLDHLAEEVNEKLQQNGQIGIAELTKEYDLPGDFLEIAIYDRLGTIIHGQADENDSRTFFTESYIAQHKARICGALSALTRPVPIAAFINSTGCPERLFYSVADQLIKADRIAGSISGGRSERSVYIPDIYAKAQNDWIDAFYKQNGYLEYDSLLRLGISDPKSYINKRYKQESLTFLKSCCVGTAIFNQVEPAVEEALNSGSWIDIMPLLPSVFTSDDCQQLISLAVRSLSRQGHGYRLLCESFVISDAFVNRCLESFDSLMKDKAQQDIVKKPHCFVSSQSSSSSKSAQRKDESTSIKGKPDKREERRKKATGGKSGGGTQGRETRTKAVKKKYHTSKVNEDSDSEEDSAYARDNKLTQLEFLTLEEVKENLSQMEFLLDCPDALISELADLLMKPLTKRYQEIAVSVFTSAVASSGSVRRKQHSELQEKINTLLNQITLSEKSIKFFSDDVGSQLYKHILKTLCTDVANMCVTYLASEYGISESEVDDTSLTTEARLKIIKKLPEKILQPVMKLHNSLNAKSLEDFDESIDVVLGAGICDMIMRKVDKKKERLILSSHKQFLMAQLSEATDPALCLHLAILLIFQTQTHNMLHASGKFVPQILSYMQKHLPLDIYHTLDEYQKRVIQHLTHAESDEDREEMESTLHEMMPKIKDIAVTFKKVSVSEA